MLNQLIEDKVVSGVYLIMSELFVVILMINVKPYEDPIATSACRTVNGNTYFFLSNLTFTT